MIDMLQDAIAHSKRFTNPGESIVYDVPRKRYFTAPMEAPLDEDAFISLDRMYSVLMKQGCKTGYETGFLYIYRAGRIERYQCIEVVSIPRGNSQNIMTIPAGHYRAIVAEGGAIERTESIFPDLFGTEDVKYALETELLTEEADMDHLVFELRCSVSSVI